MNGRKPAILMPALIGGIAGGVLSGVPFLNCLCCLWIIGGGILASYLLVKESPVPLTAGDGARAGAFSGVIAAAAASLIGLPLAAMNSAFLHRFIERMAEYVREMPAGWERWFDRGSGPFSLGWFLIGVVINAAVFAVLAALGGIIGISIFNKRTTGSSGSSAEAPPPPSPPGGLS